MGCGAAKTSVIRELNAIITQIKKENKDLEDTRNNLKLQQEMKSESDTRARDSMNYLCELASFLEDQLLDVKHMGVAFLPPTNPDVALNEKISYYIQFQTELDEKINTINQLSSEIFDLNLEKEEIRNQIADYNQRLEEIDSAIPYDSKQYFLEQNYYKEQIYQLEDQKKDLTQQLKELEETCKKLSDEIISFDERVKDQNTDAPTYEYLITLSNIELMNEIQKVEKELQDLGEHLRLAKQKEVELEEFHNYMDNLQRVRPTKLENLKKEYEDYKEKTERLYDQRNRLKEEVEKLKNGTKSVGFDKNMQVLNGLLEKDKAVKSNLRAPRLSIAGDFEETLKRAKEVANSISNIRTRSVTFNGK